MEYVRSKIFRSTTNRGDTDDGQQNSHAYFEGKPITIHPGQVEQATHAVTFPGLISLEELRFWAYVPDPHEYQKWNNDDNVELSEMKPNHIPTTDPFQTDTIKQQHQQNKKQQRKINDSYLDIVVFEIPIHCSPGSKRPCDLPSHGIGSIIEDDNAGVGKPKRYLSLCNETSGRLHIDPDIFQGYRTALHIPPSGYLMKDRITNPMAHKIPSFPSEDSQYEVLIANCDQAVYGTGRNMELSGQILFEVNPFFGAVSSANGGRHSLSKDSSSHYHIGTNQQVKEYGESIVLDLASELKLLGMALSICLFFSLASFRVRRGTRSDYFTEQLNERRRNANVNDVDGSSGASEYTDRRV